MTALLPPSKCKKCKKVTTRELILSLDSLDNSTHGGSIINDKTKKLTSSGEHACTSKFSDFSKNQKYETNIVHDNLLLKKYKVLFISDKYFQLIDCKI